MDDLRATPPERAAEAAPFTLTRFEVGTLLAQTVHDYPQEACGIILLMPDGETRGILPSTNVSPTPETHYEIDPRALRQAASTVENGGRIEAIYHSHTNGALGLSPEDREAAAPGGRPLYPESVYLVIASQGAEENRVAFQGYRWDADRARHVECQVDMVE